MSCMCVYVFPYILQKYAVLSNAIGMLRHGSGLQPLEDILVYLATEFPADLPHSNTMEDNNDTSLKLVRGKKGWLLLSALVAT